jgi:methyl-accepting chemotaxis protein-1 (serine sensor receptor)
MVSATLVALKLQMQEWTFTLLRGTDPAKLDKYWTAFQSREETVDTLADELKRTLTAGNSQKFIERFATALRAMGEG